MLCKLGRATEHDDLTPESQMQMHQTCSIYLTTPPDSSLPSYELANYLLKNNGIPIHNDEPPTYKEAMFTNKIVLE